MQIPQRLHPDDLKLIVASLEAGQAKSSPPLKGLLSCCYLLGWEQTGIEGKSLEYIVDDYSRAIYNTNKAKGSFCSERTEFQVFLS